MQFSIEVTPKADISKLPKSVKEVSITFLPGADPRDVVAQAVRLRREGFEPIPHVPARSMGDRLELYQFITQLKEAAQIRQVLLVGGSREPIGTYRSTLELLETGVFHGLRIGVAGHPEGMPQLDESECDRILALKNQYARDTGTEMFIVTQWSLEVVVIQRWLDRIQPFNQLPIYLGIPGPTSPAALLKFARICGVKTSLLGLRHQSARLGQLLTVQTPDYLVDAFSDGPRPALEGHRIDQFHIFTFGGIQRTQEWLASRQVSTLTSV
ncbi:metFprotein [filamentous cyanobacterium CCP5]|nr:metFprotein [filamentous cyanobacterium CCP5]